LGQFLWRRRVAAAESARLRTSSLSWQPTAGQIAARGRESAREGEMRVQIYVRRRDGLGGERRRDPTGSVGGAWGDGLGRERRRDPADFAGVAQGDGLGRECRQDPGDSTGGSRGLGAGTAPRSEGFRRWSQAGAGTAFPRAAESRRGAAGQERARQRRTLSRRLVGDGRENNIQKKGDKPKRTRNRRSALASMEDTKGAERT